MEPADFKIWIDMDGVLANLTPHLCRLIAEHDGVHLTPDQIVHYKVEDNHPDLTGKVYRHFGREGFYLALEPIPGAIEYINKLINFGFDVSIATKTSAGQMDKLAWIKQYIPKLSKHKVVFISEKWWLQGNVFIDDHVDNLQQFANKNPSTQVICFNQPHNQAWDGLRAMNWNDVYNMVMDEYKFIVNNLGDSQDENIKQT